MQLGMEPLISSSCRQFQQVCRSSKHRNRAAKPMIRSYIPLNICRACRAKPIPTSVVSIPPRRWASQARGMSSKHRIEEPMKKSAVPGTHFDLFPQTLPTGPPPQGPFVIDTRQLRKEFLQLQAVAHPDRHAQEMKQRAEGASARINEAYKTLQNPLLRAQYLLSLRGIDVAEDETAKVEDPELLMEVLNTRELIEEAEEEEDLQALKSANDERIEASEKVLEDAFREDDLVTAKEEAVKLRYWVNIKDSLHAWERGKPVVLIH